MDCTVTNNKLVPLSKVVNSSIIDAFGDIGRMEQRHTHWGARKLKDLYNQVLPKIPHKVWLPVSSNTHTATLPIDFNEETFVGFVDTRWHKVPLKLNNSITDTINIVDIPCESPCPKCNQDTSICNDLVITQTINLVVVNDNTYEQTIVKKLYPNGDYYLETTNPVYDLDTTNIIYVTKKEFIVNFDLKPCGCLDTTPLNTANLISFCPDIYCNYYAPCDCQCNLDYGYKIFEESGLIQMDQNYPYDKVYIEYNGFILKKNGQYYVPQVAFETLVEWMKFMDVDGRRNVPNNEKQWRWNRYRVERGNMEKMLGRVNLSMIIDATMKLPKFDFDLPMNWYGCFTLPSSFNNTNGSGSSNSGGGGGGGTTPTDCCVISNVSTNFVLALKVDGNIGSPVAGSSTYQNNILIGAYNLEWVFVAKQTYTKKDNDFTFNSGTGIIDISPNIFIDGDSLIIPYNKTI